MITPSALASARTLSLNAGTRDAAKPRQMGVQADGFIGGTRGPSVYFQPFAERMPHPREAMAFVTGRTIDIGAGAGRAAHQLQRA